MAGKRFKYPKINRIKGDVYASVSCCASETTLKLCKPRKQTAKEIEAEYTHGLDWSEHEKHEKTFTPDEWDKFRAWRPTRRGGKIKGQTGPVTYDALRNKKSRIAKNAKTIVAIHGRRVRFVTITVKENVIDKKQFLYMMENLRKDFHRNGFTLNYTGMIERQKRGAWHLHCLAYLTEDDWNYKEMQRIAKKRGIGMDFQELDKANRTSKKIASYMIKLDAVVIAAYAAKMDSQDPEDYCYTLTSKGCTLPKRFYIYDQKSIIDFINGYGFYKKTHEKDGAEFFYYFLESETFSREIYDSR